MAGNEGISVSIDIGNMVDGIQDLTEQLSEKAAVFAAQRAVNKGAKKTVLPSSKMIRDTIDIPATKIKKLIFVHKAKGARSIDDIEAAIDYIARATNASGFKKKLIKGDPHPRTRRKPVVGVEVQWLKSGKPQIIKKAFVMRKKGTRLKKSQVFLRQGPARDAIKSVYGPKASDIAWKERQEIIDLAGSFIQDLLPKEMNAEMRRMKLKGFGKGRKDKWFL